MITFSLVFLLGNLFLQTFAHLPSINFVYIVLVICVSACCCLYSYIKYYYLPLAFALGFIWSAWYAHSQLSWSLPAQIEGNPVFIKGYIASLPVTDASGTKFEFEIHELDFQNMTSTNKTLVRLYWSQSDFHLRAGDQWQLLVNLKKIHGVKSPGAFDFEAWALQKGIRASGYVVTHNRNRLLSHDVFHFPIAQIRQKVFERLQSQLAGLSISPWLFALIIGERNGVSQSDWQVLRSTGTNHLMAIAGLHIGIVAAMVHFTVSRLWRRSRYLALYLPAQQAGACAALISALIYSGLAGFSIPTQRACLMLSIFIITIMSKREVNAWNVWSFALMLVQFMNPLCVLTESFWLSFGTIALIIYGMSGRLGVQNMWWKWGRMQWVIGIGLLPLTLALFQECSIISVIANSVAIPWLEFFILPFCLLGSCLIWIVPKLGTGLLIIANKSFNLLWMFLSGIAKLNISVAQFTINNITILIISMVAVLLFLLPIGMPGRWLGIIWFLPALFIKPTRPAEGEAWLTVLDVGQGLAAIVQTNRHNLVYDTGPSMNEMNMGESVVLPYLRSIAINQIDKMIISHGDNDHIGGAGALLKSLRIAKVQSSIPEKIPAQNNDYCRAGYSWSRDKVTFTFLNPTDQLLRDRNNNSCVLLIDNGEQRILLTGDIEKSAEKDLLLRTPDKLSANIIVAPHHGSKTSGMKQFIAAVHPEIVIYATGYRNRYHFPHQSVMTAYTAIHAQQFNTATGGSIQIKLAKGKPINKPDEYRRSHKKYWND